jgi:hypothetical protein
MAVCPKCGAKLDFADLFRLWTLRSAQCRSCDASLLLGLPRGVRRSIQGIVGLTYGLTVLAGHWAGWGFLESTAAYLFGFLLATITLVLPFLLTGRFRIRSG